MSRKVRLTSLQGDILWLLEEAGAEEIATLVATLRNGKAWPVQSTLPGLYQQTFDESVRGLVQLGYVVRLNTPKDSGGSLVVTVAGQRALTV
jgi:hypothetical protein